MRFSNHTLVATLLTSLVLSGCATVLNDKTQAVNVRTSNNQAVTGTIGDQTFNAPGVILLERGSQKTLSVDTADCDKETQVSKGIAKEFWANIFSGLAAPASSTTDLITKKMWTYSDSVTIRCGEEAEPEVETMPVVEEGSVEAEATIDTE